MRRQKTVFLRNVQEKPEKELKWKRAMYQTEFKTVVIKMFSELREKIKR